VSILFALATLLVYQIANLIYVLAQAALAHWCGVKVQEVAIGFPTIWKRKVGAWDVRVGVFPFGSSTRFSEEGDDPWDEGLPPPPGTFEAATSLGKLIIVAVGPLSLFLMGLFLLAIPVWYGANQLAAVPPGDSQVRPCAVGGLAFQDRPSSWDQQFELFRQTALEFFSRLLLLRSMDGWGGILGFFVTCGAAGVISPWGWLTCIGVVMVTLGVVNLLPCPGLNGFHAASALCEMVTGDALSRRVRTRASCIGVLFIWLVFARAEWIDIRWLWGVIFG
jgi:membrane-associated protease RseP (regulator of RpoE activity)